MSADIVQLANFRPMNAATRQFMTAMLTGDLFPEGDNLIAYACEPGEELRPFVVMLARHGVVLLSDIEKFQEREFFGRFHFPVKARDAFLDRVQSAGARFAPSP